MLKRSQPAKPVKLKKTLNERLLGSFFDTPENAFDFAMVEKDRSMITGHLTTVRFPRNFGRLFRRNEQVALLHVDSTKPKKIALLLKRLAEKIPILFTRGISGIYGDTQDPAIQYAFRRFAERNKFQIKFSRPPFVSRMKAKARYKKKVEEEGFPEENLKKEVVRIAIRFYP